MSKWPQQNVWRTSMSRWVRPPSLLFVHRMWAVPSQRLQPRQVYWTDSCFAALCLPRRLLFILYLLNLQTQSRSGTLWCPLIPFAYIFVLLRCYTNTCLLPAFTAPSFHARKHNCNSVEVDMFLKTRTLIQWYKHENTPSTSGQVHGRPWYVPGVASGHWQHQVRLIVTKQPDFGLLSKDM